jgi:hypothetical protein
MTRAGTGGARFPSFSASLSASYLLELAIIAASYFGIAKTALLVPAINATAMPIVAADWGCAAIEFGLPFS